MVKFAEIFYSFRNFWDSSHNFSILSSGYFFYVVCNAKSPQTFFICGCVLKHERIEEHFKTEKTEIYFEHKGIYDNRNI